MINLPIEVGDTILGGRFKNKKIVVKEIGEDSKGQPTVNGKGILKVRVPKLTKSEDTQEFDEEKIIENILKKRQEK